MHSHLKRSVIDCSSHLQNSKQQNGRRNLSSQNSQSSKSRQDEKLQLKNCQENPIFRVTLRDDQKQNELQSDIFSPYFDNQKYNQHQKSQAKYINKTNQSQSQYNNNPLYYNWMSSSYSNFDNLEPSNNIDQIKQQNSSAHDFVAYKQVSTGSCYNKVNKFQSLNNIDSQIDNKSNCNSQDNFSLVSNKGRYIVHQKVKKATESLDLPSTFFTTPQYKDSKNSIKSFQNFIIDKSDQQDKNPNVVFASSSSTNQNVYKVNMKNDKIFAQFVPCFTFSSQSKHRQIPQAQQNQQGVQQKSQTSIGQSRSQQNIQEQKEENRSTNTFKSSQNLDLEKQKKNFQSQQNRIQYKFDLLNNLFTKSALVQGKGLNNELKKFSSTNGFQNKKLLDVKANFGIQTQQEQAYQFQVPQLSNTQSETEKTQSNFNNLIDKNAVISTATQSEQPDSSLSQDEILLKQSSVFSSKNRNFIDEIKSSDNEKNLKSQLLSEQENKIFSRYDWTIQNNTINQNKVKDSDLQNKNNQKLDNKMPINRQGSLNYLDEQENNNQQNKPVKKYFNSSFTKLPSQCKIGALSRQSINQFKSVQDIQSQKEEIQVDEKKIMEDYRQYLLRKKLDIKSKCVAVYDLDKKDYVLRIKGQKLSQIASLTKIMTCYVVCDLLNKYDFKKSDEIKLTLKKDQIITVSKIASKMIGTSAFLQHGDQLTLWDLLHGLMLPSGNDAAFAISEYVGSLIYESSPIFQQKKYQNPKITSCNPKAGQKEFIRVMNQYAQKLKLQKTIYQNPHGLTNSKNKSCADDICILISHAMKNQYFREIVKTIEYTAKIKNSRRGSRDQTWENTNKLLKSSRYCIGVKTGITPAAGACLSSCFSINNRNFIIVILNTQTLEMRFTETIQIFKFLVDIYQLDKQTTTDQNQDFDYKPDQSNIIENKYLKNGLSIASSSNFEQIDDSDQDSQDDDDNEEYEDDDEDYSNQEDEQEQISANSFSKTIQQKNIENNSDEDLFINEISEIKLKQDKYSVRSNNQSINSIKSNEILSDNNLKNSQKQQIISDDEGLAKQIIKASKKQEIQQNNEFNNLLRDNSDNKNLNHNIQDQDRNIDQARHSRSKKLSKIQEEDN